MIDRRIVEAMYDENIKEAIEQVGVVDFSNTSIHFREMLVDAFMRGAETAISELWHDASEEPELKDVIVCCAGKSRERCVIVPQEELAQTIKIFEEDKLLTKKCTAWEITARCLKVGKWCYVDDILPKKEVDK